MVEKAIDEEGGEHARVDCHTLKRIGAATHGA